MITQQIVDAYNDQIKIGNNQLKAIEIVATTLKMSQPDVVEELIKGNIEVDKEAFAKQALLNINTNQHEVSGQVNTLGTVKTAEVEHAELLDHYRQEGLKLGYKNMPMASLPSKGNFYPIDFVLEFRALTLEEIKYYSTMDENDIYDVNDKIYSVLQQGVRCMVRGKIGSFRDLTETDKIYMIFAIRDLTMLRHGKEVKLTQVVPCTKCEEKTKVEIVNDIFGYYEIPRGIMRWYNEEKRGFYVTSPKLDSPIEAYVPTIGTMDFISKYVREKEKMKREGKDGFYDKQFMTFLQFLVPDWRMLNDKYVSEMYGKFKSVWNSDKHQALIEFSEKLAFSIKPTIDVTCKNEHKANVPIIFRRGYRSIFDISGIGEELFSDSE